ncbi:MAG: HAMP domain-containing sensor histidine kinase [Candidatus Saccharibacteria bacterium]|uniref:histidine kinase n=1 Tax=Candidatus Nanosyncoccus alces TaxID=2171997 RepID=A0ABY0FML0_9BACT|nr:HAMP domain-containing sensor histidine kinase [Candidatus Nanosyncoccus alces]MDO4399142.1 HAMP domain-containing sensor histidine kinase [Candidatus Saccharibacteria bacterium]RYC75136.1 putative sensor histidine kinase TcrY [Candidatus Nanosyncoccus alces]
MDKEVDGILVAAHELKAPLAVLRQLALSFGEMNAGGEHIRTEMVSVSERAIKQVNDLVKIRRLEDGLFSMEPVAVREVCDAVSHELRYLFRYNYRDLHIKYTNKSRLVTANRDLLYSVVYNFLLNAMHYSDDGARAELVVQDAADKVKVTIRDYGPTLPIDIWREIKRGWIEKPTSIAMRPGSSGLGLYIASRFSRYMHADVGAVRHRDGTSFYVKLPISKQASLFE